MDNLNGLLEALPPVGLEALPPVGLEALPRNLLEAALREDFATLKEFLIRAGFINPSVTLIRKAAKMVLIHKCCSCPFHGDSKSELRKHLKKNKCFYNQEKLLSQKADLMKRVKDKTSNANIQTFSDLYRLDDTQLTPALKANLNEILYLQLFLIKLGP